MDKNRNNKEIDINELEEKSLSILNFIETLVDKNEDGTVKSGDVMVLLGGTIHFYLRNVRKQLSKERAEETKKALVMVVKMA